MDVYFDEQDARLWFVSSGAAQEAVAAGPWLDPEPARVYALSIGGTVYSVAASRELRQAGATTVG